MSIFDDSYVEVCNSNAFVDIVIAGGHRRLSTNYTEHNLSNQSKNGRNFELPNKHIVFLVCH